MRLELKGLVCTVLKLENEQPVLACQHRTSHCRKGRNKRGKGGVVLVSGVSECFSERCIFDIRR